MKDNKILSIIIAVVVLNVLFGIIRAVVYIGAYSLPVIIVLLVPILVFVAIARKNKTKKKHEVEVQWREVKTNEPASDEQEVIRCPSCGAPNVRRGEKCPYCNTFIG